MLKGNGLARLTPSLGRKLTLVTTAAFQLLANSAIAGPEISENSKLLFAPPIVVLDQDKFERPEDLPVAPQKKTSKIQKTAPHAVSNSQNYWTMFKVEFGKDAGSADRSKSFDSTRDPRAAASRFDQLKLGDGYLGIDTQKRLIMPEPLRKADCATDEECSSSLGIPKPRTQASTGSHLKKPFVGFTFSQPIR